MAVVHTAESQPLDKPEDPRARVKSKDITFVEGSIRGHLIPTRVSCFLTFSICLVSIKTWSPSRNVVHLVGIDEKQDGGQAEVAAGWCLSNFFSIASRIKNFFSRIPFSSTRNRMEVFPGTPDQ